MLCLLAPESKTQLGVAVALDERTDAIYMVDGDLIIRCQDFCFRYRMNNLGRDRRVERVCGIVGWISPTHHIASRGGSEGIMYDGSHQKNLSVDSC